MLNDNRYLEVQDHDDLLKDTSCNAVLNADTEAFIAFKNAKRKEREINNKINNLENKLNNIENLLSKLLEK